MTKLYQKETKIVLAILFLKLILITLIPLTGDEAYFITWATNLSSGYYDHPPMVGWLIYLMKFISSSFVFFRMFSFIAAILVAFSIYKIAVLYVENQKAIFIGLIFLASPIDILMSLFTNDIPLVLFGTLGTMFLLYSFEKEKKTLYAVLSGIFLAFAFLSKYFTGFLLVSLVIFIAVKYKTKAFRNGLIVAFIVSLAIAQNLYFNYNSCWNNIMFNFFARTSDKYSINGMINLFVNLLYIATPWGIYFIYKSRKSMQNSDLFKLIVSILGLMLVIFFTVSLKNSTGLHWYILFTPYIFLLFAFLDDISLQKLFKYNTVFTSLHIIVAFTALFILYVIKPQTLIKHKNYSDITLAMHNKDVCEILQKDYNDKKIFTVGYTTASMLSYGCNKPVHMIFTNSKFGRLDDKLVDVRKLDKTNIYLFDNRILLKKDFDNVCSKVDIDTFKLDKATFYMATCHGFNYKKYKKHYLNIEKERFYTIPKWLPKGKCYFLDRYYK